MKFFSLIKNDEIHIAPDKKSVPAEEFSTLLNAEEVLKKVHEDIRVYKDEVAEECARLKEEAKEEGFQEGLKNWNEQLAWLEKEVGRIKDDMNKTIVPLALTAVKKIIGQELETNPETITDIVRTALKPVSQHRKIAIFVNKDDLDLLEQDRNEIKKLFEHLETLAIKVRDDVARGGCIIETEAGIINAQLDSQMKALEAAFQTFFDTHKKKET